MEITNEIKVKVFGQYAKKNMQIMYSGVISNLTAISLDSPFVFITTHVGGRDKQMVNIENVKLITKLLSDITDEDLSSLGISRKDWNYLYTGNPYEDFSALAFEKLRSKGYDLPNYLLDGKTLIESGLAVDIKTLK
jgi:hypothetical protein